MQSCLHLQSCKQLLKAQLLQSYPASKSLTSSSQCLRSCVSGCKCKAREVDAHHDLKASQTYLSVIDVRGDVVRGGKGAPQGQGWVLARLLQMSLYWGSKQSAERKQWTASTLA